MEEWNAKLKYKEEATAKLLKEIEEQQKEENKDKPEAVTPVTTSTPYLKLDPSPSLYVIAVEGMALGIKLS